MTRYTCAMCGRRTQPFVFVGAEAVGPTCARRAGLTPAKASRTKGHRLRFVKLPAKREAGPQTPDLFDQRQDEQPNTSA